VRHVAVQGGVLATAESADLASFTLTEEPSADPRTVTVPSIETALDGLAERIAQWPIAATVCGYVTCRPGATLGLPELVLGLIPGAG
jgi:hypothetical protein